MTPIYIAETPAQTLAERAMELFCGWTWRDVATATGATASTLTFIFFLHLTIGA